MAPPMVPPCWAAPGVALPGRWPRDAAPRPPRPPRPWQPRAMAPAAVCCFYSRTGGLRRRLRAVQMREPVAQEEQVAEMLRSDRSCPLSRRLKDVVFVKEMRDAITSGEFAMKLEGSKGLGAMNYQSLCNRLHVVATRLAQGDLDLDILPPLESQQCLKTVNSLISELESRMLRGATEEPQGLDPRMLLYIREDQTVDLDGALNDLPKMAKFSSELWERLNGGEVGSEAVGETPLAAQKREAMEFAKKQLKAAEDQWQAFVSHAAELNEAPEEERTQDYLMHLREEFRSCEQNRRAARSLMLLRSIEWSLQSSADELENDLQQTSMADWAVAGQQQKLQVAELALMEKQATSYEGQAASEHLEELEILEGDCSKFAARLGLKQEEESKDLNSSLRRLMGQIQRAFDRTKSGLEFYSNGVQLLWQDVQYAWRLVSKATFSNYTLRAWEVRTLQRTVKDLLTLIPFLIILIIPLSPVGHVLVFSFFQKNFPEFFPSSFTEQRQNITKIYRDIAPDERGGS